MSNIYGIKECQYYHFPPAHDGISDPEPISSGIFLRLIDSVDTVTVRNTSGTFIYNVEGDLLAFEIYTYTPDVNNTFQFFTAKINDNAKEDT